MPAIVGIGRRRGTQRLSIVRAGRAFHVVEGKAGHDAEGGMLGGEVRVTGEALDEIVVLELMDGFERRSRRVMWKSPSITAP